MHYDVIVIGGGPSGMIAAGRAGELGKKVLLIEKNVDLGAKLKISGNGRCNITNTTPDLNLLLNNYGRARGFLYSSFTQFGVAETIKFFESRGLPIMVEEFNRAFPESEDATDVVKALIEYLKESKVTVRTNVTVSGFLKNKNKVSGVIVNDEVIKADSFIIATGGLSHPETGSTGDGFGWLSEFGCEVVKPTPSVVPLTIKDKWIKSMSGISFPDVKISFFVNDKKMFSKKGRVLCTHFGLSGPLILNCSAKVADLLHVGRVTALIDLFPAMDHGQLDKYFLDKITENINCSLSTLLRYILPAGTAKTIGETLNVELEAKVNKLSKQQRVEIINKLKGLKITITGLMGMDRAVVVDGGLSLKEVDGKTMRLNNHGNVYVTGDLLNIRRPSGGFSLQLCWTTGYVAGSNA